MTERFWRKVEIWLEWILFASRWLLAPFYLGLAAVMFILLTKFAQEFWHLVVHAFTSSEADVIVGALTLVDFALMGSLIVIVILSGYENFVSRIHLNRHEDWPEWMGAIDFSALKLKLLSSIVAISGIQLLKYFMNVTKLSDRDLGWAVAIHVVFVVSSVLLALSDRIAKDGGSKGDASKASPGR